MVGERQRTMRARATAAAVVMAGLLAVAAGTANPSLAGEPLRLSFRAEPEVYMSLPPPPELQEDPGVRVRGRRRIEVPAAVTINAPPYVCDLEGDTFADKQAFVSHLRARHGAVLRDASDPFVVDDGQVHFIGDR